jgi:hypothetical protein
MPPLLLSAFACMPSRRKIRKIRTWHLRPLAEVTVPTNPGFIFNFITSWTETQELASLGQDTFTLASLVSGSSEKGVQGYEHSAHFNNMFKIRNQDCSEKRRQGLRHTSLRFSERTRTACSAPLSRIIETKQRKRWPT